MANFTVSWKGFSTSSSKTLLILIALVFLNADALATELTRPLVTQTDRIVEQRKSLEVRRGLFQLTASIEVRDGNGSIGASITPGPAYYRVEPGKWLSGPTLQPVGSTALEIRQIEFRVGNRTVGLISPATVISSKNDAFRRAISLPVSSADNLEIRFHVRVGMSDTPMAEIPSITDSGLRTIVYRPGKYTMEIMPRQNPGRPPRPAALTPLAAGLVASPESPFVGDQFSAIMIIKNSGELPSDTTEVTWRYGSIIERSDLPPLAAGKTTQLRFSARADTRSEAIVLTVGGIDYEGRVRPVKRSLLEIVSARVTDNFAEDSLLIAYAVRNAGSGSADSPRIHIKHDEHETEILLASLEPGDRFAGKIAWDAPLPGDAKVTFTLADEHGLETFVMLPLARKSRPRPAFTVASMEFQGERISGRRGRFVARIKNTGSASGSFSASLEVRSSASRVLGERKISKIIEPNATAEFATDYFPMERGILKGFVLHDGKEYFHQVDVSPASVSVSDQEALITHLPGEIDSTIEITRSTTISFPPVAGLEEIASSAILMIPFHSWSPRNEARPVLRVGILDDRFDVGSSETMIVYALPREALSETLSVSFEPLSTHKAFITGTPAVRLPIAASENGRIIEAVSTESGICVTIENRAGRIDAGFLTIAIDGLMETHIPIMPGSRKVLVLEPELAAGYHTLILSTPNAPAPAPVTVEHFVAPDPLPILKVDRAGRATSRGKTGMIAIVAITQNNAHGIRIETADTRQAVEHAPAGEFAVFFVNSKEGTIRFGNLELPVKATEGENVLHSRLRLIDTRSIEGQAPVIRFLRSAENRALPPAYLYLSVNGLLSAQVYAPAVAEGERYVGAIRFARPLKSPAEILIFEESKGEYSVDRANVAITSGTAPGRGEWDWTRPVLFRPRPASTDSSVYLRLAAHAMKVIEEIARTEPNSPAFPISPQAARDLDRTARDTSAMARITYRARLRDLVSEWKAAWFIMSGKPLPATLEPGHVANFQLALENIERVADSPGVVERADVENALEKLDSSIRFILGISVPQAIMALEP